jgi:hypothetical protein
MRWERKNNNLSPWKNINKRKKKKVHKGSPFVLYIMGTFATFVAFMGIKTHFSYFLYG